MPSGQRLFASTELAARIERAEARLVAGGAAAAARRAPEAGAFAVEIAGGVAAYVGADSPFNKVAGLGFAGELDPAGIERLARVERLYAASGTPVRIELATLAAAGLAERLTGRGYALAGFENVLARALEPAPAAEDGEWLAEAGQGATAIDESPPGELGRWIELMIDGFAHPDAQGVPSDESFPRQSLAVAFDDMVRSGGFRRYVARIGGQAAGAAGLRLDDGVAQLCGAATLPAFRRRGVQSALLDTRLAAAAREGCDLAVVTTQPGSKSQQNVQRQGFELLYARAVLVRAP